MTSSWVDDVTKEEWQSWLKIAGKAASKQQIVSSLGSEDYAAQAIERLLGQESRPENVEAWIRTVLRHIYIDRSRKIVRQKRGHIEDITEEKIEREMMSFVMGPSTRAMQLDEVQRLLNTLSSKEQQLLVLSAGGMDNHEIAVELGYANNKIVATRIKQVAAKLRVAFHN